MPRSVWMLLVAWLALTVAAVVWAVPHQEESLAERAGAALAGQAVGVEFRGRDAILVGQVESAADLDRAAATVRAVRGVRRVEVGGVSVAPPADDNPQPTTSPPEFDVRVVDGTVTLSGVVPDQATVDALVLAATTRWGPENVINQLRADAATAGAAWLPGVVGALSSLAVLEDGGLHVRATGAVLDGTVPDEATRSLIAANLTASLGAETPLSNELLVVALIEPSFQAELVGDDAVRLRGVMPDQESIDAIVAAAAGIFGSANVINEMTVGTDVASPDYLAALPAVFGAIDGLTPWSVTVEGGAATVAGLAVSEDAIARSVDALSTGLGAVPLSNELQVDSSAVATVLTQLLEGVATFQIGSATLSEDAISLLDEAIEILQSNPTTVLRVEGHTDDVGSEEANLALSQARAEAVVDYLVTGGIDPARLSAVGLGESQPIADNSTADGRSQNRRIEFVVEQGDSE